MLCLIFMLSPCQSNIWLLLHFNVFISSSYLWIFGRLQFFQDPISKAWYLYMNKIQDSVGHWLKEIMGVANTVRWGRCVFSLPNDKSTPPMGSGHFKGMSQRTCFMAQITAVNGTQDVVYHDNAYIRRAESRCYPEGDNSLKSDLLYQCSFVFRGLGGNQCWHKWNINFEILS